MADEDKGLYVVFNLQPVLDKAATEREGRHIYKDVEYIEIHVPGDKTNVPHRPVTEEDRQRFATTYNAWRDKAGHRLAGQPLKEWPLIKPSEVSMLAHANVHTVEALAAVSDENISRIGPVRHLVAKAKDYIAASKEAAPVAALQERLREQEAQMRALQERLEQALSSHHQGSEEPAAEEGEAPPETPKRRGRPPKAATEG